MNNIENRICEALRNNSNWVTFEELCSRMPDSHDWIDIAARLERLVECGFVQYRFVSGADVGQYKIE